LVHLQVLALVMRWDAVMTSEQKLKRVDDLITEASEATQHT